MKSAVGSATYSAPEVFSASGATTYTKACDLWSLGVMTYVMFCKKPPFWGPPQMQLRKMQAEDYPMKSAEWQQTSADAKDFIKRLLKADPQQRMTIDEALCHPFLTGNHQKPDPSRMESVLSNMVRFSSTPRFYSLVMASAARQLDHMKAHHLTRCFNAIDTNHDGHLDVAEIRYAFEAAFGKSSQEVCQVQQMFSRLDLDGTGNITFTEFCAACMSDDVRNREQTLWFVFKAFDNDDLHGVISVDDIEQLLSHTDVRASLSEKVYQEAAREIIEAYDHDHDGGIDFEEFKCMVQACAKPQAMRHAPCLTQAGTLSGPCPDLVVTSQDQSHGVQSDALAPEGAATRSWPLSQPAAVSKKSKSWTLARLFRSAKSAAWCSTKR
jgi:calcium-dependent protein kinase